MQKIIRESVAVTRQVLGNQAGVGCWVLQNIVCEKYGEAPGPGGVCVCAEGFRGDPCAPYIGGGPA